MALRVRSTFVAGVLGALALVLIVAPATFADTKIGQFGVPGPNALTDSKAHPGVWCNYSKTSSDATSWAGKLTHLTVRFPHMATAHPGIAQKVDWYFIVQRKANSGAWSQTYQSTLFAGQAPANGNWAALSNEGVNVSVPSNYKMVDYRYRVFVYMEWYNSTNGVTGGVERRVDKYLIKTAGEAQPSLPKSPCEGYIVIGA